MVLKILEKLKQEGNFFIPKFEKYNRITEGQSSSYSGFKSETDKVPFNFKKNMSKANISLGVNIQGVYILPENEHNIKEVKTSFYRNYTIFRNGKPHMEKIKVSLNKETEKELSKYLEKIVEKNETYLLLDKIITESNFKEVYNQEQIANNFLRLTELKVKENIRKNILAIKQEKTEKTGYLNELYSNEQIEYLATFGITNEGFKPLEKKENNGDKKIYEYTIVEIKAKEQGMPKLFNILEKFKSKECKLIELKQQKNRLYDELDQEDTQILLQIKDIDKKIKKLEKELNEGKNDEIILNYTESIMYNEYLDIKNLESTEIQQRRDKDKKEIKNLEEYFSDFTFNYITSNCEIQVSKNENSNYEKFQFKIETKTKTEEVTN